MFSIGPYRYPLWHLTGLLKDKFLFVFGKLCLTTRPKQAKGGKKSLIVGRGTGRLNPVLKQTSPVGFRQLLSCSFVQELSSINRFDDKVLFSFSPNNGGFRLQVHWKTLPPMFFFQCLPINLLSFGRLKLTTNSFTFFTLIYKTYYMYFPYWLFHTIPSTLKTPTSLSAYLK